MQQFYNFLSINGRSKRYQKTTFIALLFISFCHIANSQTFDLTAATTTNNTPTSVSETLSGITMTVLTKNAGINNTAIATVGAFGTNQVAFHSSSSTNTEEMIISFNVPVNINMIRVISTQTHTRTWTFTPTGGVNIPINKTGTFASSTDVTLGFIGVNSITITSNFTGILQEQIVFDQLTLAVLNTPPTVTTTAASLIGGTTATLGGNATADGGATITERGVVYSTSDTTPTIAEGATKNSNGSETGVFSEPTFSLTAGTTYYVNAYAINSEGTSYGTPVSFTTSAPTVTLGLSGSPLAENGGVATITATLSAASGQNVVVTIDPTGTATGSGIDYTLSSTTITINAGATTGTATITGADDAIDESAETVIIDITGVSNGTESGTQQVTASITDDDAAPTVTLGLSGSPLAENGGVATITATLSAASGQNVVVTIDPTGTATGSGTDYTLSSTTITINAGAAFGTAIITGQDDAVYEGNETIIIDITGVSNGTESGTQQVTATVTDDDLNIITWTGITNNDWDTANNWNTNTVPTSTSIITIPNGLTNYPTASIAITFNSLTINSGASFIPQSTVTGAVTYKRALSANWHLVSSPVSGATYQDMIANHTFASGSAANIGLSLYSNTIGSPWIYAQLGTSGIMTSGLGASVKLATAGELSISGTANTADVTKAITTGSRTNLNLVGNPFTAYVNSKTFATVNTGLLSEETIWLWNGTTYVTYNATNPIEIAAGQAFFVDAGSNGNVTFAKTNQSHQADTFMRPVAKTSFELFVENETSKKSTKVFYIADKTTGFDNGYDSKMFTDVKSNFDVFTELISENKGNKLAIQSLPNTDLEAIVVPVGITAKAGEEVTFSVNSQNFPSDVKIYLEDRIANTFTDISETSHKVVLGDAANSAGQFYIHTTSKNLEIASIQPELSKNVSIYKSENNSITISGLQTDNATLNVFSILGQKIISKSFKSTGVSVIQLPKTSKGVYIIELNSDLGTINKKIILE